MVVKSVVITALAYCATVRSGLWRELSEARAEWSTPGASGLSGSALWQIGRVVITAAIITTNLAGVAAVLLLAFVVLPLPETTNSGHVEAVDAVVAGAYILIALPLGAFIGTRRVFELREWLAADRPATEHEQRLVLRAPLRLFSVQVGLWWAAALLFGALNSAIPVQHGAQLGSLIGLTVAITGLVTAACAYLITERILRPTAARAIAHGMPGRLTIPGVAIRTLLAWSLGTALPILGLVLIGVASLAGLPGAKTHLDLVVVVLGGVSLVVGAFVVLLAARATADPLESLRRALEEVQHGNLDLRVPVYDGTQIGKLQLGFNQMVAGLAERQRLQEAFGTYVDPDIAEQVLRDGTSLAGEVVEVTVMFIDVRGFTTFAEKTPAPEVVKALNGLFESVVPVIHRHGGRIDKFIGDGVLAVFGTPRRLADHADQALAAALEIDALVRSGAAGDLSIGIGINSGPVVSGNIGGAGRLEFSVIGDVVNVASRVEGATRVTGDSILLTGQTRAILRSAPPLTERPGTELKGKNETVRLYTPA